MLNKETIVHLQEGAIQPVDRIVEKNGRLFSIGHEGISKELLKPSDRIIEVAGQVFEVKNDGSLRELERREQTIAKSPLKLHTLSGLIAYIKSNLDRENESLYLHVEDEKTVILKSQLNADGKREELAIANAIIPDFTFDYFYDSEKLNIALQSVFINNEDSEALLRLVGNIVEDNTKTIGDDGISQSVVIKSGIASVGEAKVPNPVTLAPYRTFIEVTQPESRYVFRMRDGAQGALFEADGGAWRNNAIYNVAVYLKNKLDKEIADGRITILA